MLMPHSLLFSKVMESHPTLLMLPEKNFTSFGVLVIVIILFSWFTVLKSRPAPSNNEKSIESVPFVAINEADWKIIRKSLDSYQLETKKTLEHLSMTLEVVELEEQHMFDSGGWKLSSHIRTKIGRLSDLYYHDLEVLGRLLVPFSTVYALPSSVVHDSYVGVGLRQPTANPSTERNFTWHTSRAVDPHQQTYDSVRQVVAHIVRDWSYTEGAPIREAFYDWCIDQLRMYKHAKNRIRVLVPGAGLGRLAWEISTNLNCAVEAMECSICMAAVTYAILHRSRKDEYVLHPFAADSFSNEIFNEARYDKIQFPDVDVTHHRAGSLSFTIATTVYDIVNTVAMILADNGIWINVGPLQWHINNQVPVSVDEFRMILENYRNARSGKETFEILHWSVDQYPIPYRNNGTKHRSTYIDAYRPLRFVLQKRAE